MATDRYSDDYTIVVGGGSGTMTVDSDLEITGDLVLSGGMDISGDLGITGNLTVSGSGDSNISSSAGNISILANLDVAISSSSDDITLTAYDALNLYAGSGGSTGIIRISPAGAATPSYSSVYITLSELSDEIVIAGPNLSIDSDIVAINSDSVTIDSNSVVAINSDSMTIDSNSVVAINSASVTIDSSSIETTGSNNNSIFSIENTSTNANADILVLKFSNINVPVGGNNWITFRAQDPTNPLLNTTRGAIQGASNSYGDYYAIVSSEFVNPYDRYAISGNSLSLNTLAGYVQFVTGSSDFGEWIELGEPSEWGIGLAKKDKYKKDGIFPIEEGAILYVRGGMAYKAGEGTPMIVTHRAALVGNKTYDDNQNLGVILSFIGQVPVIVEGVVKDGDYLIPKLGANHCIATNKTQITFEQYKSCIGTSWGNSDGSGMSKVNCAVGIK